MSSSLISHSDLILRISVLFSVMIGMLDLNGLPHFLKNAVYWDVTPCRSCKNGHFGGTYRHHHQGDKNQRTRNNVLQLLVAANVVPSSPIRVTLMMEAVRSSEMSVLTRATWRNIAEDDILHGHRPENLKSYIAITGWAL
jgi:hypothetical protein